ncbi:hypothetical protein ECANGB1_695 [Enterospora canceri]|uniref:Uncharacterized protein n=1 Tax=Enterospora canceri TaxID=1081671 RepID=A0A1Y1S7N2_9MICR|nr:hypothetical protein ECANGB1_695 [Enterospora canceri]
MEKYLEKMEEIKVGNGTGAEIHEFVLAMSEYILKNGTKEGNMRLCEVLLKEKCKNTRKLYYRILGRTLVDLEGVEIDMERALDDFSDSDLMESSLRFIKIGGIKFKNLENQITNQLVLDSTFINDDLLFYMKNNNELITRIMEKTGHEYFYKKSTIALNLECPEFNLDYFVPFLQNSDKLVCMFAYQVCLKYDHIITKARITNLNHFASFAAPFIHIKFNWLHFNSLKNGLRCFDDTFELSHDAFDSLKLQQISTNTRTRSDDLVLCSDFDFLFGNVSPKQITDCEEY